MNNAQRVQVFDILHKTITKEPVAWDAIMAAVKKEMVIKNWLDVRGVIQFMKDEKMIVRVDDVHCEQYYKL